MEKVKSVQKTVSRSEDSLFRVKQYKLSREIGLLDIIRCKIRQFRMVE